MIPLDFTSKCFIYQPKLSNLKLAWFEKQIYLLATDSAGKVEVTNFASRGKKLIMSIGLQYYVNLNGYENFSIRFEKQSTVSIQSFPNVMGWKQPSNHFRVWKCFMYVKIWLFCKPWFIWLTFALLVLISSNSLPCNKYKLQYINAWCSMFTIILHEAMFQWSHFLLAWVVSGRFLLVIGRLKSFLGHCTSFHVISRSFQVVLGCFAF